MSVQQEVLFLAYVDKAIAIWELKRKTLIQVTILESYTTTTVVVAVVPLW